ncbi:MAG: hypothetical protein IJN90_03285 [Bacilli bacterium]|nr:hypothetical protein [Bacilli bacterium]
MFKIFSKANKKPFVVSKEFVKEILESRTTKEKQDEIKEMAQTFEENNLGKQKIKRK